MFTIYYKKSIPRDISNMQKIKNICIFKLATFKFHVKYEKLEYEDYQNYPPNIVFMTDICHTNEMWYFLEAIHLCWLPQLLLSFFVHWSTYNHKPFVFQGFKWILFETHSSVAHNRYKILNSSWQPILWIWVTIRLDNIHRVKTNARLRKGRVKNIGLG